MKLIPNSMEQGPYWEVNKESARIPPHLQNLRFRYRFHKSSSLVPILSQINLTQKSNPFSSISLSNGLTPTPSRLSDPFFP
jgi:hypothetical protein